MLPGACQTSPGNGIGPSFGGCCYDSPRYLITHGRTDVYNDNVGYRAWVKFGESTYAGGWAGAGTNGGTNVVIIDASWPVMANFGWNQLGPMFAGARIVAAPQPMTGDYANVPDRGWQFAHHAVVNINSSVFYAWTDTLNALPQTDGGPCVDGNYDKGGGHGFNGCGCHLVIAADSTSYRSQLIPSQGWLDIQSDAWDAYGANYYTWAAVCNYDSVTYPWRLP